MIGAPSGVTSARTSVPPLADDMAIIGIGSPNVLVELTAICATGPTSAWSTS
jgi:hypothetical protein